MKDTIGLTSRHADGADSGATKTISWTSDFTVNLFRIGTIRDINCFSREYEITTADVVELAVALLLARGEEEEIAEGNPESTERIRAIFPEFGTTTSTSPIVPPICSKRKAEAESRCAASRVALSTDQMRIRICAVGAGEG